MKWKLSPTDYLKGYEEELFSRFQAKIEGDEIIISRETTDSIDPQIEQNQAQEKIFNFLTSISLAHKRIPFTCVPSGLEIESGENSTLYAQGIIGSYSVMRTDLDFILTNSDGEVIRDSKRERMTHQKELYELINKYGADKVALKILDSYNNALKHDEKSLLYLYEIREALKNVFNGAVVTIKSLNLSSTEWDDFGHLTNKSSVRESRHNWKNLDLTHNITDQDRNFAFTFGQTMIEKYLRYLQQEQKKTNSQN